MRRRQFLQGLGSAAGLATANWSFATGPTDARLVVIVLRGGLDGLAALPAHGDPAYVAARGRLALDGVGQPGGVLDLDGTFGLHPALSELLPLYAKGHLLPLHAASVPYRERSHFDGQDVLENGTDRPFGAKTGWLNRALTHLGGQPPAMAVGRSVPLLLRGPARAGSVDPLRRRHPDDAWLSRVQSLYDADPLLGPALAEGLQMQALMARHRGETERMRGRGRSDDGPQTAKIVARVLAATEGPRVAVLEMGGFDTHAGQKGAITRQLTSLSGALAAFAEASTEAVWRKTAIVVVTEFGRTVAANGTGGSDHGVGGAAFLLGGAVAGGRVIADWPGLGSASLLDGRDLLPTTDLRSVFKGVLHDHLRISKQALLDSVFPGSGGVEPMQGLIQG